MSVGVAAQPAKPPRVSAFDKATLEKYIRHLFVWGPQIQVDIGNPKPSNLPGFLEVIVSASAEKAHIDQRFYVSKDGQKIFQGNVYDIKQNPFQSDLDKLKNLTDGPSLGTPGAPVVLVVFSDFECPYCKEEAKMLRQNLISHYPTQVHFYFRDFPLEAIHPWAKAAAIAGRCVFQQSRDAFWLYHDWMYDHQSEITAENVNSKVLEFAQGKPIDAVRLNRCLETRATEAEIDKSIAEGRALDINATPTLFINGRRLATSLSWPQLRGIIDYELEYQKTANNAGENCGQKETGCEVTLPSPLSR